MLRRVLLESPRCPPVGAKVQIVPRARENSSFQGLSGTDVEPLRRQTFALGIDLLWLDEPVRRQGLEPSPSVSLRDAEQRPDGSDAQRDRLVPGVLLKNPTQRGKKGFLRAFAVMLNCPLRGRQGTGRRQRGTGRDRRQTGRERKAAGWRGPPNRTGRRGG